MTYLLGDYAMTMQPQTLARCKTSGAAPSPDIIRLKGVRFISVPEPPKGLELNAALVKQFSGGDTQSGRFLYQNIKEYLPEFKLFINANYLPRISDDTVFVSGRIKAIPFDRHFTPEEQDKGLKKLFREPENMSGILNWLLDGYKMYADEGLEMPAKVYATTEEYRKEELRTDFFDKLEIFFNEFLIPAPNMRLKTSEIYEYYVKWSTGNAYNSMSTQDFVGELRRRYDVKRDKNMGNVVIGIKLKAENTNGDT